MNKIFVSAAAAALAIGVPLQAQSATELVVNGSFEDGLNGWTCDFTDRCNTASDAAGVLPGDGSFLFTGFQNEGVATLSQTIDTMPGITYDFSFFSGTSVNDDANVLRYSLDGGLDVTVPRTVGALGQTTDSFIASGSSAVISFFFETDGGTGIWFIDQVSVTHLEGPSDVPLPAAAPLLAAALGIFGLAGLRRRARG